MKINSSLENRSVCIVKENCIVSKTATAKTKNIKTKAFKRVSPEYRWTVVVVVFLKGNIV